MKTILTVETTTEHRSRVRCHADAVLYLPSASSSGYYTSRYSEPSLVYALSLIGPEQTLRAIAAGCSLNEVYKRTEMEFRGPSGKVVKAKWGWRKWTCRATRLAGSTMHMVAIPELTVAADLSGEEPQHVIIATGTNNQPPTRADLIAAVYQRLLLCYSTPLIPIGIPGQPLAEAEIAERWRDVLVTYIMEDSTMWKPLSLHPEQTDRRWAHAGILTITTDALDKLVSALTAQRRLVIPEAA